MTTLAIRRGRYETDAIVAAATAGDESAFSELVARHRRELQAHAYRLLGSHEDSEDLTQETFLRAWHKRESFRGRSSFRAWLYGIATNTCLTALERRARRPDGAPGPTAASIQPDHDGLLEGIAGTAAEPETELVSKETMELAFLVAVRHLPPRQRAVLFLRDVLGWSAKETAALLETSVVAVNSALQRARATLRTRLPERRLEWARGWDPTEEERTLLRRYLDAAERGNAFAPVLGDYFPSTRSEPRSAEERCG